MRFGVRLYKKRKKDKLCAGELAGKCGLSRSYITLIELGKRMPGKKVIPKIASALGVKTNVIINWYLEDLKERLQ